MSELIQLVYASKATFKPAPNEQGVEPSVARILMQSRRNNSRVDIGGVLYFGDGHFFQVLEGQREEVDKTYQRIVGDGRHSQVTILAEKPIRARVFSEWSMKYVPVDQAVREFVRGRGEQRFAPLDFQAADVDELIQLFHRQRGADAPDRDRKRSFFNLRRWLPFRSASYSSR